MLIKRVLYVVQVFNSEEKGGLTPLLAAIEYGHLEMVELLLYCAYVDQLPM